jgi:lipopolysaccharide/colanic/teichoic acid biosynthesis glycosyltransferase
VLPKLRTMTVVNPRRVTVVGRLLRGSRLDELPTLVA